MLSTQFNRDNQYQASTKPSLLAGCIALALLPSAAFAAPATEETVIVEGSATAPDDGENDYSVTSTSAGTKMQMTQRDGKHAGDQQKSGGFRSCSLLFARIPDR